MGIRNESAVNSKEIFPGGDVERIEFGGEFAGVKSALSKVGTGLFFFVGSIFFFKICLGYYQIYLGKFLGIVGVVGIGLSSLLEFQKGTVRILLDEVGGLFVNDGGKVHAASKEPERGQKSDGDEGGEPRKEGSGDRSV